MSEIVGGEDVPPGDTGRDRERLGRRSRERGANPKDEGKLRVCSVSKARRDASEGMMAPRMPVVGG